MRLFINFLLFSFGANGADRKALIDNKQHSSPNIIPQEEETLLAHKARNNKLLNRAFLVCAIIVEVLYIINQAINNHMNWGETTMFSLVVLFNIFASWMTKTKDGHCSKKRVACLALSGSCTLGVAIADATGYFTKSIRDCSAFAGSINCGEPLILLESIFCFVAFMAVFFKWLLA
jgi:hypothetical protein